MPEHTTRTFLAGEVAFSVVSNQRRLCEAIEQLFADLPDGDEPAVRFTLTDEDDGTRLDGADLVPFTYRRDTSAVMDELVTAVNRLMLDADPKRLHLHAGAVTNGDSTVLVSAPSGTGKTTLITALALRGWTYLTDEAVSLARRDDVRSFPKPLSIKPGGHELFPDLADHGVSLGGTESGLWQVPVGQLGLATATSARPTMIVVLSRGPASSEASWEPMSAADTVVALIEQCLDFERCGEDALLTVAELCAACQCVHVEAGPPNDTADLVENLARPHATPDLRVASISVDERKSLVEPDVVSVAIGTDAVLHHSTTGRILSLNAGGAGLWEALCGGRLPPGARSPEAETFVDQLVDAGFVGNGDAA